MGSETRTGIIVFCFIMAGVIMAAILETLYTNGIMIDEFITGTITISDLMAMTIIIWLLVGVIVAVAKR